MNKKIIAVGALALLATPLLAGCVSQGLPAPLRQRDLLLGAGRDRGCFNPTQRAGGGLVSISGIQGPLTISGITTSPF